MPSNIETYGWNEHWRTVWREMNSQGLEPGRVTARWRDQWEVADGQGAGLAQITGRLRRELPQDLFPEVGDFVGVRREQGSRLIAALLPRRNALRRHAAFSVSDRQVIAANVDVAFAAMALDRDFNLRRMERYLTAIHGGGVPPVALLTKADLCPDCWSRVYRMRDAFPELEVLSVSAVTGEGVEELKNRLAPGCTVAVIGSSGVGKSTLLNLLAGDEVMRTGGLRSDGARGAHTTTYRQMAVLPGGALYIDTPGMRELGVVGEGDGLASAFADVEELAAGCRFRDCRHEQEPGCAVRAALEDGTLDAKRLKNYRSLQREMEHEAKKARFRLTHPQKRADRPRKREWE